MTDIEQTDTAEKAYAAAASEMASPAKAPAATPEPADTAKPAATADSKPGEQKEAVTKEPASETAARETVNTIEPKPARKPAVPKPAPVAAKPAPRASQTNTPTSPSTILSKLKDTDMVTATKTTEEDYTARVQEVVKTAQERTKTAFEKGRSLFSGAGEFTKGNLEALVESSKILSNGFQALGKTYAENAKSSLNTVQADVKELSSVKSPAEFVKLQGLLVRKYLDTAVANNSKGTEAVVKLYSEALKPISNRVSLAVEKVKKAA